MEATIFFSDKPMIRIKNDTIMRPAGFARDSNAHRRSHLVWAPAHKNFLVKIFTPPFKSYICAPGRI